MHVGTMPHVINKLAVLKRCTVTRLDAKDISRYLLFKVEKTRQMVDRKDNNK